jgi:hypothetical protein
VLNLSYEKEKPKRNKSHLIKNIARKSFVQEYGSPIKNEMQKIKAENKDRINELENEKLERENIHNEQLTNLRQENENTLKM